MPRIVVSHRSEDVPGEARRIRAGIVTRFPSARVLMAEELVPRRPLGIGDVLIVVIGPRWFELMRRHVTAAEHDEVRADISSALVSGTAVIPVRVGRADDMPAMPRAELLPEDIRALTQTRSHVVAVERLDVDTIALADTLRSSTTRTSTMASKGTTSTTAVLPPEPAPGNSMLKLGLWSAAILAATAVLTNVVYYISTPSVRPGISQTAGPSGAGGVLSNWTGEGRIRRAIEAAFAKGRRPEEARRCQSALITATDAGTIQFNSASADLDQRSYSTLDDLARIIAGCPDFGVEIEGHTDSVGDASANQRLSERRAEAVRTYLERAGVPARSLTSIGYGATRPIAPNDTAASMARNRRIELNVTAR